MKITEEGLIDLGFTYIDYGDDSPYEAWSLHGVEVWNFNNKYWVIDILDQTHVDVEYRTIEDLNVFFSAIGKPLNVTQ